MAVDFPSGVFACRYALEQSGWKDAPAETIYFIVDNMEVEWTDGVPEILDCESIDIVAIV